MLTSLSARGDDGGQTKHLSYSRVRENIVAELFGGVVTNELEQPDLVVDDEERRLALVQTYIGRA